VTADEGASHRREATNVEVVAWALGHLGGVEAQVHLEDVAVKAFALKPGAFRWDLNSYSNHIDKDKVRVSLTDAAKPEYGQLTKAVGKKIPGLSKPTDWWLLTPGGTHWINENAPRLAALFGEKPPALKREVARRLRERLRASELYVEYTESGAIDSSPYALADLVECSPDASNDVFRNRFSTLHAQAALLGDDGLDDFLQRVAASFAAILGSEGGPDE
jgi:hypothetical protein